MSNNIGSSSEFFLANMRRLDERIGVTERQISSGKRVSLASDAPEQVSEIVNARGELRRLEQIRRNLELAQSEVDTAEHSLQTGVKILERLRTIAIQAAGDAQTAEVRATLGVEVGVLLDRLVGIAAARHGGRYVFSGDNDRTAPYSIDLTQPNGVSAYAGGVDTRQLEHPSGFRFSLSRNAQDIFESNTGQNIFEAVNAFRIALETNDVPAAQASIPTLQDAHEELSDTLSLYGSYQRTIRDAVEFTIQKELRQKVVLGTLEDTDIAEAAITLTRARSDREAAYSARARTPRTSLFDYLG
jgi:flagellar hook-associated protein 3 FlgL